MPDADAVRTTNGSPARQGGLVIIGAAETASCALAALAAQPGAPVPRGVVLLRPDINADLPVPVLGTVGDLPRLCAEHRFSSALVSIPAAMAVAAARVSRQLSAAGVPEHSFPAMRDVLAGRASGAARETLDLLSLVGRDPQPPHEHLMRRALEGRRVLITGAGGSIGSELARIAARYEPAQLLLVERSENALFEIDREIHALRPNVSRRAVLHDVVDAGSTETLFKDVRPHIVFHAAAHKHVPMMEDHPAHAVRNNLFGARSVANASLASGVTRFVMISTDKAVNPSSVMGATKRFAELFVRAQRGKGATRFCMVRFGNVLGSACSVLPIWESQISEGGPVTITDPRMTRYFMTIPEAAALVIQAGAFDPSEAGDADVFVLDMGQPVRITDLAARFIAAHGLTPSFPTHPESPAVPNAPALTAGAMPVVFTGARPGERLHEQLAHAAETLQPTPVNGILAWKGSRTDPNEVERMVHELETACEQGVHRGIIETIRRWTPGFGPRPVLTPDRSLVGAA